MKVFKQEFQYTLDQHFGSRVVRNVYVAGLKQEVTPATQFSRMDRWKQLSHLVCQVHLPPALNGVTCPAKYEVCRSR